MNDHQYKTYKVLSSLEYSVCQCAIEVELVKPQRKHADSTPVPAGTRATVLKVSRHYNRISRCLYLSVTILTKSGVEIECVGPVADIVDELSVCYGVKPTPDKTLTTQYNSQYKLLS